MSISKTSDKKYIILCISAFCFFIALTVSLCPMSDDWYYSTSPNVSFTLDQLKPTAVFWRPFDVLFGVFNGLIPNIYPIPNRIAVVLAHVLSAYFLVKVLNCFEVSEKGKMFSALFFLFSPAATAVVISPDALNQAFSVLFGLIAVYFCLTRPGYLYLIFCVIALFWKESGIAWFAAAPILKLVYKKNDFRSIKEKDNIVFFIKCAVFAVIIAALYFALRFYLYGQVALSGTGNRYSVSIFDKSTVINFARLIGIAVSGIDSIAMFSRNRNLILFSVTLVMSMIFILMFAVKFFKLRKHQNFILIIALIVVAAALTAPQIIIESAGEMHAYPSLAGVALIYGVVFQNFDFKKELKKVIVLLSCIIISFSISSVHKYASVYHFSNETKALTNELHAVYDDPEKSMLIMCVDLKMDYSVFCQPAIVGTSYGKSLRQYFGWRDNLPIEKCTVSKDEVTAEYEKNKDDFDIIIAVKGTDVTKLK